VQEYFQYPNSKKQAAD
jgi:hypothetical protein